MKRLLLTIPLIIICLFSLACGLPQESVPEYYTLIFVQGGEKDVVIHVNAGETIAEIPTPVQRDGYDIYWDKTNEEILALTASATITAIKMPKEFTITYKLGQIGDEPITIPATTQKVKYNKPFQYYIPTNNSSKLSFQGWGIVGTNKMLHQLEGDLYIFNNDITVIGQWKERTSSAA